MPLAKRVGGTLVVNPGSAGEARFIDGRLELSCAVLDTITEEARLISFSEPMSPPLLPLRPT